MSKELKTSPRRARARKAPRSLDGSPQMVTIREVARKFAVTPVTIRKWTEEREFALPHMVIGRTWMYRADVIDHKLRTGNWPQGIKLAGDRVRGDRLEGIG